MIEPAQSDDAFLADVRATRDSAGSDDLCLWWLGQSGFLLLSGGKFVLFDPYLSESLTRKYADTDKPHVRMTRRVIDPARLNLEIAIVTSTHNHTDHLDAETLRALRTVNPRMKLVAAKANVKFAADRVGMTPAQIIGIDAGETATLDGVSITAVPAAHETLDRNKDGRYEYLGYVVEMNGWTVYHSGDTIRYAGMEQFLRRTQPIDIALLSINGSSPTRRVAGNLDGPEAATLARDIGADLVIPCHFEMFEFNTADPAEFVRECERLGQRYRVLQAGERFVPKRERRS